MLKTLVGWLVVGVLAVSGLFASPVAVGTPISSAVDASTYNFPAFDQPTNHTATKRAPPAACGRETG